MPKSSKTADPRLGLKLVGGLLILSLLVGYAVLPMLQPGRSRLVGVPAPEFTLPVIYNGEPGSRLSLGDLRGKTVVIDFWASWCAPCRAQAPIIDRVARAHESGDVVILGVSTSGDDWADAVSFARGHNLSYTSVFDRDGTVARAYGVRSLPTLVVVDADGQIAAVRTRVVKEREIEALITQSRGTGSGAS